MQSGGHKLAETTQCAVAVLINTVGYITGWARPNCCYLSLFSENKHKHTGWNYRLYSTL